MNIPGYDDWRLAGPIERMPIGQHEGDTCNRVEEPDDEAPRGYCPKPCNGVMVQACGEVACETCGGLA